MSARVLVVDDELEVRRFLEDALAARGYVVQARASVAEALAAVNADDFDVVVTDLRMPGESGTELARRLATDRPDLPVILVTAFGSMDSAVAALRAGAYDFITKPFEIDLLVPTLERALAHRALQIEVKRLRAARAPTTFEGLLGQSPAMRDVFDLIDRVADTDSSVVITGESGTGKELVAQALHHRSPRRLHPFVAINCAALPEALLESELFGHERGAFTDARGARTGLFLSAEGGTLFLDEIGELPLGLQPKLLRALQGRTVRPVGSDKEVPFDVRVVAATNRDLEALTAEGRFRSDLYYRLNVIPIALPPLRVRGNDILVLAQSFLDRQGARGGRSVRGFSPAVAEKLLAYDWPGNVRELQNCVERAVALARFDQVGLDDLPAKIRDHRGERLMIAGEDLNELVSFVTLDELERRYIQNVMAAVGGNKTVAARILGLDRTTLWRKLERAAGKTARSVTE